jgi:hypothetical protein
LALLLCGAACVNAQFVPKEATGSGGQGSGGSIGTGGSDMGLGGDTGAGGSGAGGSAAGGSGMGGAGTGGAIVDAGSGGSNTDAPYDGPTGITPYAAGQLVITEIMADPADVADESGEWFEIYNPSATDTYDLFGCLLADSGNQDTVASHILMAPQSFVTMARFGTVAGGFVPDYDYHTTFIAGTNTLDVNADVKFSNQGDAVTVTCGLAEIDTVNFKTWVASNLNVPHGRSYSLPPNHYSATDNDVEGNWCVGTTVYHTTDLGTPGRPNPACSCMDGADAGACAF